MQIVTAPTTPPGPHFVEFLIDLQSQLLHIIDAENGLLRDRKYNEMAKVQSDKHRITAAYETQIKALSENPMLAQNWPAERKEKLRDLTARFDKVARDNVILLQAAQRVNARVLEAIRNAAMDQKQEHKGYGNLAKGSLPQAGKKREQAVSVTLDQRL
jgi:hypothetical protein